MGSSYPYLFEKYYRFVFVKKASSNDANDKFKSLFGENNVFKLSIRSSGATRVF